ncbi:hypothetical protein O0I10_012679 [Lichtheimia ornata]|uniref:Uncharacterized protein n=1 Tax=Lichtheimia ornata TaxID=688661 RepID=A0AAD7USE6_9FUNG|nr:uncharacterized protein O0I10_012679 [Lichtheimia ornata]KAJ8651752.1 hypothetical protein O0I10_012679 [Lichtheimia ornata]
MIRSSMIMQWETDTEDDDDTYREYTADSHRKRPRGQ